VATTPTTTTLSPEVVAAMTRVKELEERIQQMERERAEAENTAADEARKKLEAQAAARGKAVDPSALARAQEDARQKARAEQERRQQEELVRLAEARREEERRIAEATPPPTTAPPAVANPETAAPVLPTPEALAPVTTTTVPAAAAAQQQAGVTEAGMAPPAAAVLSKIVPPTLVSQVQPLYPPIAQMRRLAGNVELTATVDETGKVIDARVVKATPARMGFEESALRAARQRKYRPATRDGVPIRMVVPIVVIFKR
jgi:protein TonB